MKSVRQNRRDVYTNPVSSYFLEFISFHYSSLDVNYDHDE